MSAGESAATNLGASLGKTLLDNTKELVAHWQPSRRQRPHPRSGHDLWQRSYDPDITPQDATVQIPMISRPRPAS